MSFRLLIVDDVHNSMFSMLENKGISYDYKPDITREKIINILDRYEGLVIRSKTRVDGELLQRAEKLKIVCRAGAGIDNLNIDVLTQKNINVINAPEGNCDAVAEHCIALILGLLTKIYVADQQVRKKIWDREGNRGIELKGKTVGIIGYGFMGSAFAQRLKSFGCNILAYDKYKSGFGDGTVKEVEIEEIFKSADIVSFHTPLTDETKNWVTKEFLKNFKKSIYLINTSRGEIIPMDVIVEGIKSGIIIGAALDVLENEKLHKLTEEQTQYFDYLAGSDKVLLSPHVAGWSVESYQRINEVLVKKLLDWLRQKP